MKRWNGWGDDENALDYTLSVIAWKFLEGLIGKSTPLPDASLEKVLASVPESRLPPNNALYSVDAEDRLRHARGQSLPDWLALRSGKFGSFPMPSPFPKAVTRCRHCCATRQRTRSISSPMVAAPRWWAISIPRRRPPGVDGGHDAHEQADRAGQEEPDRHVRCRHDRAAGGIALAPAGYTLGHYPQSWELSTIGGWVASRSSGQQSMRYGRIEQMFAGGRIETLKGTLDIPTFPASSAGPDLREFFLGTEGRMGIITEVKARVTPLPEHESFHVLFFP